MFDITKLYLDIEEPSDETIVTILKKEIPYFYIFNKSITEIITYKKCKSLKGKIMNNIIMDLKLTDDYHNLIIDTILDKNFESIWLKYILQNNVINLTVEICSAIVYVDPFNIRYVPNIFHDNEMLEDALCLSPFSRNLSERIALSNLFFFYIINYKPSRKRRYLDYILFERCEEEINDQIIFPDNILSYIKDEEKTYRIEKKIVESCPENIKFSTLLNDDDIIEVIKKDKNIIFLVRNDQLSYNIILESIKMYGNYIFFNNRNVKINLNFLTIDRFNDLKKELKIFYYNDRFSRKYIKMFNIIDLCMKNMLSEET